MKRKLFSFKRGEEGSYHVLSISEDSRAETRFGIQAFLTSKKDILVGSLNCPYLHAKVVKGCPSSIAGGKSGGGLIRILR